MATIKAKTYHAKAGRNRAHLVRCGCDGQTVGRLASRVAHVLRGKHKPQFTPSIDTGDFVIMINAEKGGFHGKKLEEKSTIASRRVPAAEACERRNRDGKQPGARSGKAIQGMLPRNTLGRQQLTRLHVYAGDKHPHAAQNPQPLENSMVK